MSASYKKSKPSRGRGGRYNCNDNKSNYRKQDNTMTYSAEKKNVLSDLSIYTIARFLMGNEVQIITFSDKYEGVLRSFDSISLGLSKVFVYDYTLNETNCIMKNLYEFKEINLRDILHIKMLNVNGKFDSVIIDQEISQRKQALKPNLSEDKNLVPYFDEDESQLHSNDEEDDLNTSLKVDQNCWYHPEVMLKVNEERFNVKNTFSENMEEYTTQIDTNDPLLKEKVERAERWAKEIENDNNIKRNRLLDDDDGQDEEERFSAVLPSSVAKSETPVVSSMKLNPNAPEFKPKGSLPKPVAESSTEMPEESVDNCQQSMSMESVHQQQQHQQQQQQQQRIFFNHQVALQQLAMTPQINPQIQRIIPGGQWQMQAPGSTQYLLQPYMPTSNQMIQHVMQPSRPIPQESMYYQCISQPFLMPPEHSISDGASHLYPSNLDPNNQLTNTNSLHQMRQPSYLSHIPIISTNQMSLHHPPQQQSQQHPHQPPLNAFYSHLPQSLNPSNFPHMILNPQQQQTIPSQIQNGSVSGGPQIQTYITNGRQ